MSAISAEGQNGHINGQGYTNGNNHSNEVLNGSVNITPAIELPFANQQFSHLTLYTGNTMRTGTTGQLNTSLKKSNQELVAAIEDTLIYSLESAQIKGDTITITDETSLESLDGQRSSYEITVKMFYAAGRSERPLTVSQLDLAIANLETALGIHEIKIDHFILSLPNQSFDENGLDDSEVEAFETEIRTIVLPVWNKLVELRQQGRIARLGVAEFSKQQLEVLTKVSGNAPEVNQVNLQDCCVLPKDLIQYSKENNIELLTHGDVSNILPNETLEGLLSGYLPVAAKTLIPNFVVKYSAFITSRGLITKKGYIVDASSV